MRVGAPFNPAPFSELLEAAHMPDARRIAAAIAALVEEKRRVATDILLPRIGFSMNEGRVSEWLVAYGATVREDGPLFLLEADKSANEVEAPAGGTLKILVEPGDTHRVGTVLGTIG